jgi:hypothetical protein
LYSLHKIPVSVFFIFLFSSATGSDPYIFSAGAAEAGMNFSCVMKPGFWSSFHNQALLPFNNTTSLGFNYQSRFNISELATRTAGLVIPAGKSCIGAYYSHFGYKDLYRHSAGLGCGLKLSEKIYAGVQTDFFSENTKGDYDERRSLTFEAGLIIIPSDKIRIGLHVFNPIPNSLRKNYLNSSVRVGAGTYLSRTLFTSAEVEMVTGRNLILKTGIEYGTGKNFILRGGFSTENNSFSFGIGYLLKSVQIDLGFMTHEILGLTSSASMVFKIK